MILIGIGLCIIGVGVIGYDVIIATRSAGISRWLPRGKPSGTYESNMEWEFPDE